MIAVGEVKSGNIHACINHLNQHVNIPTGRAESGHDFCLSLTKLDLLKDALEFDAIRISASRFYHSCVKVTLCISFKLQNQKAYDLNGIKFNSGLLGAQFFLRLTLNF